MGCIKTTFEHIYKLSQFGGVRVRVRVVCSAARAHGLGGGSTRWEVVAVGSGGGVTVSRVMSQHVSCPSVVLVRVLAGGRSARRRCAPLAHTSPSAREAQALRVCQRKE